MSCTSYYYYYVCVYKYVHVNMLSYTIIYILYTGSAKKCMHILRDGILISLCLTQLCQERGPLS